MDPLRCTLGSVKWPAERAARGPLPDVWSRTVGPVQFAWQTPEDRRPIPDEGFDTAVEVYDERPNPHHAAMSGAP
jgi:hypothetical protein